MQLCALGWGFAERGVLYQVAGFSRAGVPTCTSCHLLGVRMRLHYRHPLNDTWA